MRSSWSRASCPSLTWSRPCPPTGPTAPSWGSTRPWPRSRRNIEFFSFEINLINEGVSTGLVSRDGQRQPFAGLTPLDLFFRAEHAHGRDFPAEHSLLAQSPHQDVLFGPGQADGVHRFIFRRESDIKWGSPLIRIQGPAGGFRSLSLGFGRLFFKKRPFAIDPPSRSSINGFLVSRSPKTGQRV